MSCRFVVFDEFVSVLQSLKSETLRQTRRGSCKKADARPDPKYLIDLRFHDLRHEATSRLAAIFPMHELTKITGHKDPRMLMRYYHPHAKDLAKRLA